MFKDNRNHDNRLKLQTFEEQPNEVVLGEDDVDDVQAT